MGYFRRAGNNFGHARLHVLYGVKRANEPKRRFSCWLWLAVVVLCASGCAITPETKRSLAAYVQASTEVEHAANLFLADFANSAQIESEFERIANGPAPVEPIAEYPSEFVPVRKADPPPTEFEKALADSRQALGIIREYNEALVALAEGRPVSEIKVQIEELGGSISAFVPPAGSLFAGIGPLAAIGANILKLVQDSNDLERFKSALEEGQGPVENILDVFREQTGSIYHMSVVNAQASQIELRATMARTAASMKSLLRRYSPPSGDATLFAKVMDFQMEVDLIAERTGTANAMPHPFPFDDAQPAYDQEAHANLKVLMSVLRASDAKYAEIVAKQNAYFELMEKYVATLGEMRAALALVRRSVEAPVDFRGQVSRLLQTAFELRGAMSEFRHPSQSPL